HVFIEARFNPDLDLDDENLGELQVVISDSEKGTQRNAPDAATLKENEAKHTGIGLSICKGLAACMGGSVHLMENKERGNRIFINVKLEVVSHLEKRFGADQKLRGKRVLLADLPENSELVLPEEMAVWGMNVTIANGYDQVLQKLRDLS